MAAAVAKLAEMATTYENNISICDYMANGNEMK